MIRRPPAAKARWVFCLGDTVLCSTLTDVWCGKDGEKQLTGGLPMREIRRSLEELG